MFGIESEKNLGVGLRRKCDADMAPLANTLIAACPDRLVWGSNWPHPAVEGLMPNDGDLLDQLMAWAPEAATRRAILSENPARLFGFD